MAKINEYKFQFDHITFPISALEDRDSYTNCTSIKYTKFYLLSEWNIFFSEKKKWNHIVMTRKRPKNPSSMWLFGAYNYLSLNPHELEAAIDDSHKVQNDERKSRTSIVYLNILHGSSIIIHAWFDLTRMKLKSISIDTCSLISTGYLGIRKKFREFIEQQSRRETITCVLVNTCIYEEILSVIDSFLT